MKHIRNFLFILSLSIHAFTTNGQVLASDSLALVALYNSTNGPGWTNRTNWLTGPVNSWFGITISGNRVTQIRMCTVCVGTIVGNNLSGTIPPELGNLSNLTQIELSNNQLTGTIPRELGNLSNLNWLYLYNNQLSGTIPPELGNLSNVIELFFNTNQLTGTIPPELGSLTNVRELHIIQNQLTGTIPMELGNLSNLRGMALSNNQLSGTIPPELGNLTNLIALRLWGNQLTGSIPSELGNLGNLTLLFLNNNQLSGTIPSELGNLSNITRLFLHQNQLTGSIPPELGNLSNLTEVYFFNNRLTSMSDLSGLTSLTLLGAQNNFLDYGDLEPNIGIAGFTYSPQGLIPGGGSQALITGAPFIASFTVGGSANSYQWRKNGVNISGAISNSFSIPALSLSDAGTYELFITSPLVPGLTLQTEPISLSVTVAPQAIVGVSVNTINQPNNSTFTYSSTSLGANSTSNFVISNTGNAVMNITSIQTTGDYAIVGAPPTSIAIGGNVIVPVLFTPTIVGARTGTIVITSDGDIPAYTLNLVGEGDAEPEVFNVVTTNSNGKHDFLNIRNITLFPNNLVSIFDRWGNKVFEKTNYDNATGTFIGRSDDGKDLPEGTYYYVIDKNNGSDRITGFLMLRR